MTPEQFIDFLTTKMGFVQVPQQHYGCVCTEPMPDTTDARGLFWVEYDPGYGGYTNICVYPKGACPPPAMAPKALVYQHTANPKHEWVWIPGQLASIEKHLDPRILLAKELGRQFTLARDTYEYLEAADADGRLQGLVDSAADTMPLFLAAYSGSANFGIYLWDKTADKVTQIDRDNTGPGLSPPKLDGMTLAQVSEWLCEASDGGLTHHMIGVPDIPFMTGLKVGDLEEMILRRGRFARAAL